MLTAKERTRSSVKQSRDCRMSQGSRAGRSEPPARGTMVSPGDCVAPLRVRVSKARDGRSIGDTRARRDGRTSIGTRLCRTPSHWQWNGVRRPVLNKGDSPRDPVRRVGHRPLAMTRSGQGPLASLWSLRSGNGSGSSRYLDTVRVARDGVRSADGSQRRRRSQASCVLGAYRRDRGRGARLCP